MAADSAPRSDRARLAIQEAAYELFIEQGYSATTMRQIALHAELALGGIYNHFESKKAIFEAIIHDRHPYKQILPVMAAAAGDTAEEFVRNAARAAFEELERMPDFLRLMFIEIVEFNAVHLPGLYEEMTPHLNPLIRRLRGLPAALRPLPPLLVVRSLIGMLISLYITEMMGNPIPLERRENELESRLDILLLGILDPHLVAVDPPGPAL